jgi:hypothetical protein
MPAALALAFGVMASGSFQPSLARAAEPGPNVRPVFVLSIWTDDADDQADALTQAMRAQVRAGDGWSIADANQSFETLAIALRCPLRPDPACLQRIADQLHADQYVWGTMTRQKPAQVLAELHFWTRNNPQVDASSSYADSLTDESDGGLRAVAARLFAKLTGARSTGVMVVRAGTGDGVVIVDGVEQQALRGGTARFSAAAGEHTVSVRVPGFDAPPARATTVTDGGEQWVDFGLTPAPIQSDTGASTAPTGDGLRLRSVLGVSAIVAGAAAVVVAGVEGAHWLRDKNASDSDRQNVPRSVADVCAQPVNPSAEDACERSKDSRTVSTLGWVFAAVGAVALGTGAWLIAGESDDKPRQSRSATPARTAVDLVPSFDANRRELDLRVTF